MSKMTETTENRDTKDLDTEEGLPMPTTPILNNSRKLMQPELPNSPKTPSVYYSIPESGAEQRFQLRTRTIAYEEGTHGERVELNDTSTISSHQQNGRIESISEEEETEDERYRVYTRHPERRRRYQREMRKKRQRREQHY